MDSLLEAARSTTSGRQISLSGASVDYSIHSSTTDKKASKPSKISKDTLDRQLDGETVLSDVRSLYDVIKAKKKTGGNPNEPYINRMIAAGELQETHRRPEARQKVASYFEKTHREFSVMCRARSEDPITGVVLIYPTQVLLLLETNSEMIKRLLLHMAEKQKSPEAIVAKYNLLNMGYDVKRQIHGFHCKVLYQTSPMLNWLPPGGASENAVESSLKRILRQCAEMLKFVEANGSDKKVMDSLVLKKPEAIPDQDPLLFVCRSEFTMRPAQFLHKYHQPLNVCMGTDTTWPTNWVGERIRSVVRDEGEEEKAALWGGGSNELHSVNSVAVHASVVFKKKETR